MTGQPNVDLPEEWEQIPGARVCTPQSCSFRDNYQITINTVNMKILTVTGYKGGIGKTVLVDGDPNLY